MGNERAQNKDLNICLINWKSLLWGNSKQDMEVDQEPNIEQNVNTEAETMDDDDESEDVSSLCQMLKH